MRILVISDSHRKTLALDRILSAQPLAHHVFFLGDNADDLDDFYFLYPDRQFYRVSGNCDFGSVIPSTGTEELAGHRILYTHGHRYGVKSTHGHLLQAAAEKNCDIVLFGHTHVPETVYENGVYLVNPGSCSCPREGVPTYAVIDLTDSGVLPAILKV